MNVAIDWPVLHTACRVLSANNPAMLLPLLVVLVVVSLAAGFAVGRRNAGFVPALSE